MLDEVLLIPVGARSIVRAVERPAHSDAQESRFTKAPLAPRRKVVVLIEDDTQVLVGLLKERELQQRHVVLTLPESCWREDGRRAGVALVVATLAVAAPPSAARQPAARPSAVAVDDRGGRLDRVIPGAGVGHDAPAGAGTIPSFVAPSFAPDVRRLLVGHLAVGLDQVLLVVM